MDENVSQPDDLVEYLARLLTEAINDRNAADRRIWLCERALADARAQRTDPSRG